MDFGSRDMISALPDPLISHMLSFLPTKEAASTSVLSKRWLLLFASVTNLEFECQEDIPSFIGFVDRVLALQGNSPLNRFSLSCCECEYDYPDMDHVTGWILNVLRRGVSNLDLSLSDYVLPSKIFVNNTLVKLKLGPGDDLSFSTGVDVVFLPNLQTLYLDSVLFKEEGVGLSKLLSGCPVLKELVMTNIRWHSWKFCSVSATTLKRLLFFCEDTDMDANPKSVSFDTPNLEYLEYSDNVAGKYPKVNFSSLLEAHIGLQLTDDQSSYESSSEECYFSEDDVEKDMLGNATYFLMGISNVQILYLAASALQVLTVCCESTPVFNNLIQLTIESNSETRWDPLLGLLKNCPKLETLIFKGLLHKTSKACKNLCICQRSKNPSSYLTSSPIKVLKIIMTVDIDDEGEETEQIKHFVEKMPRLEQLVVYYNTSDDSFVFELSKKLHDIPRIASPKCNFQVISQNLTLSSTSPSSLSKKWSPPPNEEYSWFLKAFI